MARKLLIFHEILLWSVLYKINNKTQHNVYKGVQKCLLYISSPFRSLFFQPFFIFVRGELWLNRTFLGDAPWLMRDTAGFYILGWYVWTSLAFFYGEQWKPRWSLVLCCDLVANLWNIYPYNKPTKNLRKWNQKWTMRHFIT